MSGHDIGLGCPEYSGFTRRCHCAVRQMMEAGMLCNIGYAFETHLKLKSPEISFVHNICLSCPIVLKYCTEHGSDNAMHALCKMSR